MSDAIEVLKKFVKDCNECCADDVPYRQPVEDAINKAILALEQKEKVVKILRDINYLMEGKNYVEVISFTNKWIKELEKGVEK